MDGLHALTCSIDGCGGEHVARGWCDAHYRRFRRHGDPLAGRTPVGVAERHFREVVLPHVGDECLIWPFATTEGYGAIWRDGKMELVHRQCCEARHGPAPEGKPFALHNCGKGHLGCVNPAHTRWGDAADNEADKWLHGTQSRRKAKQ